MRRLLGYLRPYRRQVALAIAAIIGHSVLELAPPYLTKIVIDRYIPAGDLSGLGADRGALPGRRCSASFALEYVQTWTMQMTGQRIMFDLRMQMFAHLQRLDLRFYDRNPVGRLMTRVTTDVDVLNELFTSGVVSVFGDVFTLVGIMVVLVWMDWRLALVAFSVLPLIALDHAVVPRNVRESYRDGAHLDRAHQRVPAGAHHRHGDGAAVPARGARLRGASTRSTARTATPTSQSIFYYAVFYPGDRAGQRAGGGADHLGRRRLGDAATR